MQKRQYTPEYKTKIVLEILREENTVSEIASREQINAKQLHNWKKEFLENASKIFSSSKSEKALQKQLSEQKELEDALMAKVGQLTVENDWLKKKSAQLLGTDWENKSGFKR